MGKKSDYELSHQINCLYNLAISIQLLLSKTLVLQVVSDAKSELEGLTISHGPQTYRALGEQGGVAVIIDMNSYKKIISQWDNS